LGPHPGLGAVFRLHDAAMAVAAVDEVLRPRGVLEDHRPLATVRLIAPHARLFAMQKIGQHRAVGDIGRRGDDRVDQLGAAVDAEMRLHAEIPLVALLRLMHLGIARLVGILGRRGRIDDRCIDDRAGDDLQPPRRKVLLHLLEQPPTQIVLLKQVAEAAHRVSSDTGSRPRSIPTNRRISSE
jgi:hypothetical protein